MQNSQTESRGPAAEPDKDGRLTLWKREGHVRMELCFPPILVSNSEWGQSAGTEFSDAMRRSLDKWKLVAVKRIEKSEERQVWIVRSTA